MLVKSKRAGQRVMDSLVRFLGKRLRLTINLVKSKVAPLNQRCFLGFTFRRKKIVWSDKSVTQFKKKRNLPALLTAMEQMDKWPISVWENRTLWVKGESLSQNQGQ